MIEGKYNICFITPSLEKGGMERVLVELANYGVKNGLNIYIITLLPEKKVAYELHSDVNLIQPLFEYRKSFMFKIKVFLYLFKKLNHLSPDVCLSFSETFNPLAIMVSKLSRNSIFISDRSNPLKTVGLAKRIIKKMLYPLASGIIAQTSFAKEILTNKNLNRNIISIPNPLRNVEIRSLKIKQKKKVIISVGRLVSSKNFSQLIDVFSETNYQDWELWIIGDGEAKSSLINKIRQLQLENHVKLMGQVDDVDKYLVKSSIFAFTSLSEGFPNALSEAMAIPLPCIAFNCPAGPADIIIDNYNGFLIPLGDQKLYLEKLQLLMNDEVLRNKFSTNAFHNRQKFSPEKTSEEYFKFILSK